MLIFPTMKSIGGVKAENGVSSKPSEEVKAEPEKIDFSNVKIEPLFEEEVDFDTFSKSDFRAVKVKECVAVPKSKKLLQFTLDDGTGTDRTILSGIHAYYEPEELVGKTLSVIIPIAEETGKCYSYHRQWSFLSSVVSCGNLTITDYGK